MKLLIAGSREVEQSRAVTLVRAALQFSGIKQSDVEEIIHGGARGIDLAAGDIARLYKIPLRVFTAEWDRYGNSAGPIRNRAMAQYADQALIVWDGVSSGTKHMIQTMKTIGKPYFLHHFQRHERSQQYRREISTSTSDRDRLSLPRSARPRKDQE